MTVVVLWLFGSWGFLDDGYKRMSVELLEGSDTQYGRQGRSKIDRPNEFVVMPRSDPPTREHQRDVRIGIMRRPMCRIRYRRWIAEGSQGNDEARRVALGTEHVQPPPCDASI